MGKGASGERGSVMALFQILAKIKLDATELNAGLKKSESLVSASMASIGAKVAAAFSVAAISAFVSQVVSAAGEVSDLADQLQITTDQVQALQVAASKSGVAFDKYAAALGKIKAAQLDAIKGDESAKRLLASVGVTENQSPYSALQSIGNAADKAAVFELLGVKSARLFSSLKDIQDLGPLELITDETSRRLDNAADAFERMKRTGVVGSSNALGWLLRQAEGVGMGFGAFGEAARRSYSALGGSEEDRQKIAETDNPIERMLRVQMMFARALGATAGASIEMLLGPKAEKGIQTEYLNKNLQDAWDKNSQGLFDPTGRKGRDSGEMFGPPEMFGPTNDEAKMQLYLRRARARNQSFSPVDLGDRANVGGFFGPNSDINRRIASDLNKISRSTEEINKRLLSALSAP